MSRHWFKATPNGAKCADPRMIKAAFKDCWSRSDSAEALKSALEEKGYFLARGDRRGVVAVDRRGECYALARYAGAKVKEVPCPHGH